MNTRRTGKVSDSCRRAFTGASLAQLAFPMGGIGTGTISLGGRGQLRDWEIFNRPNKGSALAMTFFALRAQPCGGRAVSKVLERKFLPPFAGAYGLPRHALAGLPRFDEVVFRGEYPFAWLDFRDSEMPVRVSLEAFNPFIPMNVPDSSIPGAIFRYRISNPLKIKVSVSLLAVMSNPIDIQPLELEHKVENTLNSHREEHGLRGIHFTAPELNWNDVHYGTAALTTSWPTTHVQTVLHHFHHGGWDAAHLLWDTFTATGRIENVIAHKHGEPIAASRPKTTCEPAALCLRADLMPGAEQTFTVFIHWHFPHTRVWRRSSKDRGELVRTHVANQFADAWDAAHYTAIHFDRLCAQTRLWHDTFFSSSLPAEVLDAVSSQLSTIRTQTVMRLSDGSIYAYEGCGDQFGCCPGNTLHVWNYEQAMAFLFPSLERTLRQTHFGPSLKPNGAMAIGCDAPSGVVNFGEWTFDTAADGQMGNLIQAYRDWQLSGDDSFLRELWPNLKRALEFAWTEPNGWDADKDGVMEGRQHQTYDGEFFGANSMMTGIYLGALRAAEEMARHLGEEAKAREYRSIYHKGRARLEREHWKGGYFIQRVECDRKYQYGDGCLSDQVIGQWLSHVAGLGHVLDRKKLRAALKSIFKYNFRDPIGGLNHAQRVYALQDEAGLVLCSWPRGNRPVLPFGYCDEVWTGVEYQVAAHMIYEGMVEEALKIVRAARARHDGIRRNPWDEAECGHHYARAMSSWSLIQALSGARYSAVEQSLLFDPRLPLPMKCVFAAGSAWGVAEMRKDLLGIEVRHGNLTLRQAGLRSRRAVLPRPKIIQAGQSVKLELKPPKHEL